MAWEDLDDLHAHWRNCPPVDSMVAAYLGYKRPTPPAKPRSVTVEEAEMWAAIINGEG